MENKDIHDKKNRWRQINELVKEIIESIPAEILQRVIG